LRGLKQQIEENRSAGLVEQYNQAAECYFQELTGTDHLRKPFSNPHEAPHLLFNLGLALANLNLGPGDLVLDFGAGACWLSASLNLMGLRTVSLEVSSTALDLGRKVFDSDRRLDPALQPEFVLYDGHAFPFPDEHFDNIICMDAFHHVPNQLTVLREMQRVLKRGRRIVFSEPGSGHADSVRSRREADTYGVLEQELDLPDFRSKLLRAGFERVFVKPFPPLHWIYPYEQYEEFMEGDDALYHLNAIREETRRYYVILAQKGEEVFTSLHPNLLLADMSLQPSELALHPDQEGHLSLTLTNRGDSTWLPRKQRPAGYVDLGAHLLDAEGELMQAGCARWPLPHEIAPGEQVVLPLSLRAPDEPGLYQLKFDLIDEGFYWFEEVGSRTANLRLRVVPL
jgi:ubiquinone/menaquinone biosynthesis C-methylase UbiE